MGLETKAKMLQIAKLAASLEYHEWRKVAHIIDQKFASASNKTKLTNTDAEGLKIILDREMW